MCYDIYYMSDQHSKVRTDETLQRYNEVMSEREGSDVCPLCAVPSIADYTHWRVIPNDFPYDRLAITHHLLIPKRCCNDNELTADEHAELINLRDTVLNDSYDSMVVNMPKFTSIKQHFHYHLIVLKEGLEGK